MKKQLTLLYLLVFLSTSLMAQNSTVNGYVRDADNGESLIGASVFVNETGEGAITNEYGYYSLSVVKGAYTLTYSYLGYEDQVIKVDLTNNLNQDVELSVEGEQIEEIVVTAIKEDNNVRGVQMSVNKLDIKTIQKIPTLLGEQDVIKSIQLLPGVTTVGEGAAGFNVRGGSIDQNLVILDEAPVYNSSHLFGFFSVFNPDAVKDVKLYKGGIPARFGGRLSSILDVRMKDGNSKDYEVNGGVGTIFSRLSVEGPITDKSSFVVAGRRSYIDVLAKPFLNDDLSNTALNFYDLTLKSNYKINPKNQVFLSGYFGRDNFVFGENAGFNWGNKTLTGRWNHLFSDKLFANFTGYYSNYDYKINFGDTAEDTFDWSAKIINYSLKPEFSFFIRPNNILRFGLHTILYEFQPANAFAVTNGVSTDISLDKQHSVEASLFVENEISVLKNVKLNYGLRLTDFSYLGGRNAYYYEDAEVPGTEKKLAKVESVPSGKVIQSYLNLEPRASVVFELGNATSIKANYNRTVQNIHLLSNTTASTPVDIWTPSTNNIRPQLVDQVALGYFKNFKNNTYEFSTEVYYKKMQNLVDYVDGADLILNEYVEGEILPGEGRAYGVEFLLKKVKGRFNGWLSYTLARTERKVEGVNKGDWYPSRFDKTHDLSLTGMYDITDRISFSANFVFASGTPTTLPDGRYTVQGVLVPYNSTSARNNFRIPNYHRLDLSLTIDPKKSDKRWKGQWVIGVYNVYNRRNAFSIFTNQQEERPAEGASISSDAYRLSVVGNFIPAISYNFKFK